MYRVILVDDERIILEGLKKVVPWAELGCEVAATATDGLEGLEKIRSLRPHMILTDIRMPNVDGLSMLAAVRSEFPGIQVSILTAYRDFDYAQRAINLGVTRYLLKPSRMPEILDAIRTMSARLDQEKELYGSFFNFESCSEEADGNGMPLSGENADESAENSEAGNYVVRLALDYMRRNSGERLSLSMVADQVYVSQWHLSKLLNRYTGKSFFDLLAAMRMERATELLKDPSLKIYAVAEMVGYTDVANFSRNFKKIIGKTPGEYRDAEG
ncbi:MAG: response regulator [Clostridia bacterium]|nr:response regulator [Clostridia bacterium]